MQLFNKCKNACGVYASIFPYVVASNCATFASMLLAVKSYPNSKNTTCLGIVKLKNSFIVLNGDRFPGVAEGFNKFSKLLGLSVPSSSWIKLCLYLNLI